MCVVENVDTKQFLLHVSSFLKYSTKKHSIRLKRTKVLKYSKVSQNTQLIIYEQINFRQHHQLMKQQCKSKQKLIFINFPKNEL